jgi:Protein of unknown function (DUF2867)
MQRVTVRLVSLPCKSLAPWCRTGGFRAHMAVYVKPNGLLGSVYMAAIRPFRHLIVYPPMLREMGRALSVGKWRP